MKNRIKNAFVLFVAMFSRNMPYFPGKERLLRLVYNPDARQDDHIERVVSFYRKKKINIDTRNYMEWQILMKGSYEGDVRKFFERIIRPGMNVLDIGANVGCHSLELDELGANVTSFEPYPPFYEKLKKNIALNPDARIKAVNVALSDSSEETMSFETFGFGDTTGRLSNKGTHQVKNSKLDSLDLPKIDFMKIDTDGNEMRVLRGGKELLKRDKPVILFEYDEEVWQESGFVLEDFKKEFPEYVIKEPVCNLLVAEVR